MDKKLIMKIGFVTAFFSFFNVSLLRAQDADVMTSVVNYTPQFFIAILAGVILALAFQGILTMLSVASGISLVGDLKDKYKDANKDAARDTSRDADKNTDRDAGRKGGTEIHIEKVNRDRESEKEGTSTGVKITSGIGAWAVLTAAISLFFASLLAVKMIFIPSGTIGFTLGLIIWAAFFMVMMYLEAKSVSSLLGGIYNTAMQGVRSAFGAAKGIAQGALGKSDEDKMVNVAQRTVGAIQQELSTAANNVNLNQKIDEYINKLQPREIDYSRVRQEISDLLNELEMDEKVAYEDGDVVSKTFLKIAESHPNVSKEQGKKIKGIFQELKGVASSEGSEADKLLQAVDKFTPGSEEDTKKFREKIENYLRSTKKEELNPDSLKRDLETIMRDPKSSRDVIRHRIGMMNKSTVSSLIAQRTDMNKEEADKYAGYVEKAINFVQNKFSDASSQASQTVESSKGKAQGMKEKAEGMKEKAKKMPDEISARIESRIKNYFDSLNREELNYDTLKLDFQHILSDPGSTFEILKHRLNQMDRESLIALLSSNDRISRADANRYVDKVLEARDTAISKAEELQTEAKMKFEEAKFYAVEQAEATRKVAATAAWWLVGAAVISAIASGLGGMIGIM